MKKKLQCLVTEMEVEGEDLSVTVIAMSALQAKLFSPAPSGTITEEAGSSQGSSVVPRYFPSPGILST